MSACPSRRSRRDSKSPSTKRRSNKRLRLDPSSSPLSPESMSVAKDDPQRLIDTLTNAADSTVAHHQQSPSTSAPAWSVDPGWSGFPHLTSSASRSSLTGQLRSSPVLTSAPLSLPHLNRSHPSAEERPSATPTTNPPSFNPSTAFFPPDTSAATHQASAASLDIVPGSPVHPIPGTRSPSSFPIQPPVLSYPSQYNPLPSSSNPTQHNDPQSHPFMSSSSSSSHSSSSQESPPPNVPFNFLASNFARDALLSHAYRLCNSTGLLPSGLSFMPLLQHSNENPDQPAPPNNAYNTELLPILYYLKEYHPTHLPILLLLGCVLHSIGNYNECIKLNLDILQIDPKYVEAMSNIGTALFSMGRPQEAEAWWWKAIRTQPLFWDAVDNILGVLCNSFTKEDTSRVKDAIHVCEFVESHTLNDNGELLVDVPPLQRHRIQGLLYTHGNLSLINDSSETSGTAISLFLKALDLIMRPSNPAETFPSYGIIDVILAVCVSGLLLGVSADTPAAPEIARMLGISYPSRSYVEVLNQTSNVLQAVFNAGPRLIENLLRMGGEVLPMTFIFPEQASRLPLLLFPSYSGGLPGLFWKDGTSSVAAMNTSPAHKMTSTILLSLARIFQSGSSVNPPSLLAKGIPIRGSPSLALLFYYLAVAIDPSPAICNNMGILLSTVPLSAPLKDNDVSRESESVNGQVIAKAYYTKGLAQDSSHPHLLTNLGSLLKDQGKTEEAIRTYAQVLQLKPDFDIALANMGNTIKDLGRPHEAISFYRRALASNPEFHEAICGLASAQGAVCDWRGRGGFAGDLQLDDEGRLSDSPQHGWMDKVIEICEQQLLAGYSYGVGVMQSHSTLKQWLGSLETAYGRPLSRTQRKRWTRTLQRFFTSFDRSEKRVNEGGTIIRLIEFIIRVTQRRWYIDAYGQLEYTRNGLAAIPVHLRLTEFELQKYKRPKISAMGLPPVPSILPFHTFTYPLSPRAIRLVSHRNALRISYTTQTQSWLPPYVYPPPAPLRDKLRIGYVSNDINNHPLAHLMQSVFEFHDKNRFEIYVYATSPSDGSEYRRKIEAESQHFLDVSDRSTKDIVERIVTDGIHILLNLGGYTKGARNDIFAARPAPVQVQLMGFAGTLAAEWCDYLVSDVISSPPETCVWERWRLEKEEDEQAYRERSQLPEAGADAGLDPESLSEEWMYTEHMIYMPHTFFVTDHKQSSKFDSSTKTDPESIWKEEETARAHMRKLIFPDLPPETIIFANFNQLYKVDPTVFATWIRILQVVPHAVLWLLRFPPAGEENLRRTAGLWATSEVASRILFTDVAQKEEHLRRIRLADLVLDTVECNAHTIAADVLWAGTPIITWPKYKTKMCSRVAASIAMATGLGEKMVVNSLQEYEERAIHYARSVRWSGQNNTGNLRPTGELIDLRKELFLNRERVPLFDTREWTRDLEKGIVEAWRRWVAGTCFEISEEWEDSNGPEKTSGCIWVKDLKDVVTR